MKHSHSQINEIHAVVGRRLLAANKRYSKSRYAVVKILLDGEATDIARDSGSWQNKGLAQSSAYRNLSEMSEIGIVRLINSGMTIAALNSMSL